MRCMGCYEANTIACRRTERTARGPPHTLISLYPYILTSYRFLPSPPLVIDDAVVVIQAIEALLEAKATVSVRTPVEGSSGGDYSPLDCALAASRDDSHALTVKVDTPPLGRQEGRKEGERATQPCLLPS